MLGSMVKDLGTPFNTEDRVTYRGVYKTVLPNVEVDDVFRLTNWIWSSTNRKVAEDYKKNKGDRGIIIEYHIPAGCKNAGIINKFGKSSNPNEEETLMPPYTAVKMKSRDEDKVVLIVAKDSENEEFGEVSSA